MWHMAKLQSGAFPLKVAIIDNRDLTDLVVVPTKGFPTLYNNCCLVVKKSVFVLPLDQITTYKDKNLNVVFTGV
jgi:hypothetical protein